MADSNFILSHEPAIRLGCFFGVFAVMALWELAAPRRRLSLPKGRRWAANLGIVTLNTLLLRALFPTAAAGVALLASERGWGLLPALALPPPLAILSAVVALDLAIYLQHVLFHAVPALWRLHRMHHADLDYDVTTGARFHPIEVLLSMGIKLGVVAALGAPPAAVVLFEVLLNATAMFNHSNVRLPAALDRTLRWLVVTPDMHRVHHSTAPDEANSNFGFNLPWWDRLLGSYRAEPRGGHEGMTLGIDGCREPARCNTLGGMLRLPFAGPIGGYAINRRREERHDA